ncbi:MAG: hypothetical protein NTZ32_20560 [Planctomycetales bacterium]|nr:hypothetical protein [Planctomycetales bacterium]
MNRLVSLVMLVAFVAQHFMCCCTGTAAHVCDHDHSADQPVCAVEHNHHDDDHDSDECDHEHSTPANSEPLSHEGCPSDHSHQHHYCIGTHVFFVSAPRAEMPQSVMCHDFTFESLDFSVQVAMTSLAAANRHGVDSSPPLSSCPQRSALCVYRI